MANRNRSPAQANVSPNGSGGFISGTYANRPTASNALRNYEYLATDVGLAPGIIFFCNGTSWKQVGVNYLCANTTNTVADSGHLSVSVFDTAPTIPNGSMAVGTHFEWEFYELIVDSGSNDGLGAYDAKIGSTAVASFAPISEYNTPISAKFMGSMTCRSTGGSGSVMGMMSKYYTVDSPYVRHTEVDSSTPTTVDTTGSVSPDVKITLSSVTNLPTRTVIRAWIRVSGLI